MSIVPDEGPYKVQSVSGIMATMNNTTEIQHEASAVSSRQLTPPVPTLVLGGNGKTGRRVVAGLEARGFPVRVGSRQGTPPFSWEDSSNWPEVLAGAEALYIAYYPDLAVPGATAQITALMEAAREAGVRKAVLLSGRGEAEARRCEQIVLTSGLEATVVRCAWFNQNFSESFFHEAVMSGTLALPKGSVREPWVDVDDIADVAIAALTETGHADQIYEVTGPRLLTFAELAAELSAATGRELQYVEITPEAFVASLRADGMPDGMVALLRYLFTEVLDGRNAYVEEGVQRALGRPPRDFREFARDAAAEGAWD